MKNTILTFSIAIVALMLCANVRAAGDNRIDSLNYALGCIQGESIRMQVIGKDTLDSKKMTQFCAGLNKTYNVTEGKEFIKMSGFTAGAGLANELSQGFLLNDSSIPAMKDLVIEAFQLGINNKKWISEDSAINFIQSTIGVSMYTHEKVNPTKENAEMLNRCVGYLNGLNTRKNILGKDTAEKDIKSFMTEFNKGMKVNDADKMTVSGMNIGIQLTKGLKQMGFFFNDSAYATNFDLIRQGMLDCLMKNPKAKITGASAIQYLNTVEKSITEQKNAVVIAAGRAFLENNRKQEGVLETPSGLQYKVIKESNGLKPTAESTVRVHYTGKLIDGKVFDSSIERGEPLEFPLGRVIKGWTEGLQLMGVGSKYILYIPYELGYGERGAGDVIPGYSTLIFEVELLEIVK